MQLFANSCILFVFTLQGKCWLLNYLWKIWAQPSCVPKVHIHDVNFRHGDALPKIILHVIVIKM